MNYIDEVLRMGDLRKARTGERQRILSIILAERSNFVIAQDSRMLTFIDSLCQKIQQDHREDSER